MPSHHHHLGLAWSSHSRGANNLSGGDLPTFEQQFRHCRDAGAVLVHNRAGGRMQTINAAGPAVTQNGTDVAGRGSQPTSHKISSAVSDRQRNKSIEGNSVFIRVSETFWEALRGLPGRARRIGVPPPVEILDLAAAFAQIIRTDRRFAVAAGNVEHISRLTQP